MNIEWTALFLVAAMTVFALAATGRFGMFATIRLVGLGLALAWLPATWTAVDTALR